LTAEDRGKLEEFEDELNKPIEHNIDDKPKNLVLTMRMKKKMKKISSIICSGH